MEGNLSSRIIEAILLRRGEPFSNKELACEIGAPPAEIDQTIGRLKTLGYEIGEIGDRLLFVLPPSLEVSESDTSFNIVVQCTVTTTMEIAPRLIERGAETPLAVFADEQTAGRGREGRIWASPNRLGIYVTIALSDEIGSIAPTLSGLAAGLAIAMTLEKEYNGLRGRIKLKWPNDILVDNRKVSGMLSEMEAEADRVSFVNVGVGVNVNNDPVPEVQTASSLKRILGREISRKWILVRFLDEFENEVKDASFGNVISEWKRYTITLNQQVRIVTTRDVTEGIARDVDEDGALILELEDGSIKRVLFGDCFHRES